MHGVHWRGPFCKASRLAVTDVEIAEMAASFLAWKSFLHNALFCYSYSRSPGYGPVFQVDWRLIQWLGIYKRLLSSLCPSGSSAFSFLFPFPFPFPHGTCRSFGWLGSEDSTPLRWLLLSSFWIVWPVFWRSAWGLLTPRTTLIRVLKLWIRAFALALFAALTNSSQDSYSRPTSSIHRFIEGLRPA